jgi:hypothetical protein
MNNPVNIRWWIIFCLQLLIIFVSIYQGLWSHIWITDVTYLSFVIMSIWFVNSVMLGFYQITYRPLNKIVPVSWFMAELCLSLGMLGTVAGFLIMLVSVFGAIDVSNTSTLQKAISTMASGMGTALYTTLIGIVANVFIKIQLVNCE